MTNAATQPAAPVRHGALARLVDSEAFTTVISIVIVINAIALGLETFTGIFDRIGTALLLVNDICFAVFVVELIVRLASYGRRPQDFFREPWNVFDFIIITATFIPLLRENAQILRLLRLLRVVRLLRFLPRASLLFETVRRAVPPVFTTAVLILLLLFVYGMIGWGLLGEALPGDWGDIGAAMRTLFVMLTLEGLPEYLGAAMTVTPWAVPYIFSYVLLASFFVLNLLIGIVVAANDEATAEHARKEALARGVDGMRLVDEIRQARESLQALEARIAAYESRQPPG
ncbi:MAG: ion transporter [Actinomycetales bacterium]|nr:ion transporter [Actinomycetales bacterium]